MSHSKKIVRVLLIVLALVLALGLRLRAAEQLPIDYDEDDYLRAAQQYAVAIQHGDCCDGLIAAFTESNYRTEHPPLSKILYGIVIAPLRPVPEIPDRPTNANPASALPQPHLLIARLTGVLFGVLSVVALALLNPLAGILLAIQTWSIKYTSQVMLEAVPAFTSLVCVLAYLRARRREWFWLALSGMMLGLTAASKYMFCVAGVAVLTDWVWREKSERGAWRGVFAQNGTRLVLWSALALLFFILADPYLWRDPLTRLRESFFYHAGYASSQAVKDAGFPLWQPFVWLFGSVPWHPGVFVFSFDLFITLFAFFGLRRLWRQYRVMALWLAFMLAFLLAWPTKWPQYILTVTAPVALASAMGMQASVLEPLARWWQNGHTFRQAPSGDALAQPNEWRTALPWLIPGALMLLLLAVFPLLFQTGMALTDFSSVSIRDGLSGGVLREVWKGLTLRTAPAQVDMFSTSPGFTREVRFTGLGLIWQMVTDAGAEVLVFDVLWTLASLTTMTVLGVGLGLLLNVRGVRFTGFWRALFILPWAIPEFVGALVWFQIFEPSFGWLTLAAKTSGSLGAALTALADWQKSPELAFVVLLIAGTWYGFPLMMLATAAGLKMIPHEVYDASAMDGASGWQTFRAVTLPLLVPLLVPALILRAIFAFNQFYLFYVLQPPYPLYTLSSLSYFYFVPSGPFGGLFAVSAAINLVTVGILIFLLLRFNRWSRAAEGVTYA